MRRSIEKMWSAMKYSQNSVLSFLRNACLKGWNSDGAQKSWGGRLARKAMLWAARPGDKLLPMPQMIHLTLTSQCNLRCRICRPVGTYFQGATMPRELVRKIVDETFDHLTDLRMDAEGELFLSRELPFVLEQATKRSIPIFISTNGTLISMEWAERLALSSLKEVQISIDSPVKETYEWIRDQSRFDDAVRGVENLVAARERHGRRDLHITFHAAIMQQNVRHLPDLLRLAKSLGIEGVTLAYCFIHPHMDPDWSVYWMKEECDRTLDEARDLAKELRLFFNRPPRFGGASSALAPTRRCPYLFQAMYIAPQGNVYPCCLGGYSEGYLLGNTAEDAMADIWHGARYQQLRQTYNTPQPAWYKCAHCYIMRGWDPNQPRDHFGPALWEYVNDRERLSRAA
jgi:radical SAM protein with 4Fe4S-binding SPASM domain